MQARDVLTGEAHLFLGSRLKRLAERMQGDVIRVAQEADLSIQPVQYPSNKKSAAAIHLYEKLGFRHDAAIMREFGVRYERCDVAMRYQPEMPHEA